MKTDGEPDCRMWLEALQKAVKPTVQHQGRAPCQQVSLSSTELASPLPATAEGQCRNMLPLRDMLAHMSLQAGKGQPTHTAKKAARPLSV